MKLFQRVEIEVWPDPGHTMRASLRLVAPDGDWEREHGGRGWSWYGAASELAAWLRRGWGATMDGYYMARLSFGLLETWTHHTRGDDEPPIAEGYHRAEFPWQLGQRLAQLIELKALLVTMGHDDGNRNRLDVAELVEATCYHYGLGKGTVRIEYSTTEIEQKIAKLRRTSPEFAEQFDRIVTIAQNATGARDQTAVARFSYDHAGFFWTTPSLHGGLIWHESSQSWSTHT